MNIKSTIEFCINLAGKEINKKKYYSSLMLVSD